MLHLCVGVQVKQAVLVIRKQLLERERLLLVYLALRCKLVHLANLCLQLLFKQVALAQIELISLFKLLDQLSHLFFLQLQASQLLLKNAVLLVIAADAASVVTPRGGRSALVTRIVIA